MSSLRAPLQNGPYKQTIHRTTQIYVEHQDATNIYKRPIFQVSVLVIFSFSLILLLTVKNFIMIFYTTMLSFYPKRCNEQTF